MEIGSQTNSNMSKFVVMFMLWVRSAPLVGSTPGKLPGNTFFEKFSLKLKVVWLRWNFLNWMVILMIIYGESMHVIRFWCQSHPTLSKKWLPKQQSIKSTITKSCKNCITICGVQDILHNIFIWKRTRSHKLLVLKTICS